MKTFGSGALDDFVRDELPLRRSLPAVIAVFTGVAEMDSVVSPGFPFLDDRSSSGKWDTTLVDGIS